MTPRLRKRLSFALALVAFAFVLWMIPVRDRCWDPAAPKSTRAPLTRDAYGCVLHLRSGDVRVDPAACARLQCEPGLETTFRQTKLGELAGLLVLYGIGTLAWAGRWRALLGFAGIDLPVLSVWRIVIEAQAGGIVLPGGIGGDALRIAAVMGRPRKSPAGAASGAGEAVPARTPAVIAVASVLLDRAIGLSVIAAVAVAFSLSVRSADPRVAAAPLEIALAAIPVGVALALFAMRSPRFDPARLGPRWSDGRVGRALGPVLAYVRDPAAPAALARAVALSVVVAAIQFVVIRGLVHAVGGAPTDEKWVYVGAAMAFIVGAVPALPGGWGTADAAYVFFFGLAGIAASEALAVCLLFRLFWYVSGVAGAVLHLTRGAAPEPSARPVDNR